MAKLLQPSVICIEDTEKIFYKKVPKEEKEVAETGVNAAGSANCVVIEVAVVCLCAAGP